MSSNYKKTGLRYTRIYRMWLNMKARCLNPNHHKYHRYGGRGVKIYEPWIHDVRAFADWAYEHGYNDSMSIDRIDSNGDYVPENLQFVSLSDNSRKKSTTKITIEQAEAIRIKYEHGGSLKELGIEFGVSGGTIWHIVKEITHVRGNGSCIKRLDEIYGKEHNRKRLKKASDRNYSKFSHKKS